MRYPLFGVNAAILGLGIGALLLSTTLPAQAPAQRERAGVLFGAFISEPITSIRLDSDSGSGTDVDLEDDFGLDSSTSVLRVAGYWWLSERNRLDFSLFDFSREGSRQISETIEFGDETFEIDTVVAAKADYSIWKAAYTFAPLVKERGYLGVTGGLYASQTKISLSEPTLGRAESEDLTAPLPVIGVRGEYEIGERVTLRGAFEWFGIDTGDVEGNLRDSYIAVDYGFGRRFAVGLAFNDVRMDIRADEGDSGFRGALDWGYDGWLLYMTAEIGNRSR
jgi:hypothetical protein